VTVGAVGAADVDITHPMKNMRLSIINDKTVFLIFTNGVGNRIKEP
jgi:hypothetical protein